MEVVLIIFNVIFENNFNNNLIYNDTQIRKYKIYISTYMKSAIKIDKIQTNIHKLLLSQFW